MALLSQSFFFEGSFLRECWLLKRELFMIDWSRLRDSCGSSGTGETHAGVHAEEAHSPPL
jgi:hypothetical protein